MEQSSSKVINLYVERQKRERDKDERQQVWRCSCGSMWFFWYRIEGLVCYHCGKREHKPGK